MHRWKLLLTIGLSITGLAVAVAQQRQVSTSTLTTMDRFEIQQLIARYAHAYDSAADNGYMYADVFTSDGMFIDAAGRTVQGREKLAEFARPAGNAATTKGPTNVRHFILFSQVDPVPGGATGKSVLIIANGPEGRLAGDAVFRGQYRDEFVKTADGWRIRKRQLFRASNLPPAPAPASPAQSR